MWKQTTSVLMCAIILTACVGRTPHPISTVQPGDKHLACSQIEAEVIQRQDGLQDLETERATRQQANIAKGIGGILLFPVWFFLDLGSAPETEASAIKKRLNTLKRHANNKDCSIAY